MGLIQPLNDLVDDRVEEKFAEISEATMRGYADEQIAANVTYECVDAIRDLGCVPMVTDANFDNASRIQGFLSYDSRITKRLELGGNQFRINSKLTSSLREGISISGAGGAGEPWAVCQYRLGGDCSLYEYGGPTGGLVWGGSAGGTMFEVRGGFAKFSGVSFQGAYHATNGNLVRTAIDYASTAGVGLNIVSEESYGATTLSPGKLCLENCAFNAIKSGFLAGNYYDTGTVSVTSGVVTITGGTWPTWAASGEIMLPDGAWYSVATRDSNTQVTLDNLTVTGLSGVAYKLSYYNNDHADNVVMYGVTGFHFCQTAIRLCGVNALNFCVENIHGISVSTYWDLFGGGQVHCMSGRLQGGSPTWAKLWRGNLNSARYIFDSLHVDNNNIGAWKLLDMPSTISGGDSQSTFFFNGGSTDNHGYSANTPMLVARGACSVYMDKWYGLEEQMFQLHGIGPVSWGFDSGVYLAPHLYLDGCTWSDIDKNHLPVNGLKSPTGKYYYGWERQKLMSGKSAIANGEIDTR